MHEARLIADLVARANAAVPPGAGGVSSVRLELLRSSHLDAATLRAQFAIWAAGTPVGEARVFVEESDRDEAGDVVLVSVTVEE